jgi:transcriptional regulator with XRE-family HTH domain
MDPAKQARLEAAGWKVGTVADFLGLSPAEEALIEARLALANALRRSRQHAGLSQVALARRMKSSQSRVAKMEAGDPSVSLDLIARAYFETGATFDDLLTAMTTERRKRDPDPSPPLASRRRGSAEAPASNTRATGQIARPEDV